MSLLGGWAGYRVEDWRHEWRADRRWLVLELTPSPDGVRRCSGCGEAVAAIHDRTIRRDLPPDIRASLILVESVSQEDGHEEAIHRRTDHRLPEAGGRRHAGQGALPQARFQ